MKIQNLIYSIMGLFAVTSQLQAGQDYSPAARYCAADVQALCSHIEPGQGRIGRCLKHNIRQVSAGCIKAIVVVRETRKRLAVACGSDVSRLCNSVRPGGGRILRCLNVSYRDLSPICAREMSAIRQLH